MLVRAESPNYFVYVSNERSGDISVIDGATDAVVATFKAGKRPRGIHAAPDGKRLFVTLSGSPRMAPGLDENRAPADKTADGLGVIDPVAAQINRSLACRVGPGAIRDKQGWEDLLLSQMKTMRAL